MTWNDVKQAIGQYAPGATALLGMASLIPGAGVVTGPAAVAVGIIAKAFGTDPTPEAIQQAITTDPAAAEKLMRAENEYLLALEQEKTKRMQAQLADVQSARSMNIEGVKATGKRDGEDKFFDWIILIGFFGTLVAFFYFNPEENTNLGLMVGAVITAFLQVINFRKGSTASGNEKTAMIYNSTPNVPKKEV